MNKENVFAQLQVANKVHPDGKDLNLDRVDLTVKSLATTGSIVGARISIAVPLRAADVDSFVWVAPVACTLVSVTEVHSVISTGAATLGIRKITANSQAPGASAGANVVELLATAIDLNGVAANTLTTASLSAVAGVLTIAAGNRIAFDFSAAVTGLAGCVVTLNFTAA